MPDKADIREAEALVDRLPDNYGRPRQVGPDDFELGWPANHGVPADTAVPADEGVPADEPLVSFLALWFGPPKVYYHTRKRSGIFRLFRIVGAEIASLRKALETTERYRDIDQATDATLDRIGSNVRQFRGTLPDSTYRTLIKGRIARSLSPGDTNNIKDILATMLDIEPSEVTVDPFWIRDTPEPAAIEITVPLDALAQVQIDPGQFPLLAERIAAGGVRVASLLTGTFAFSSKENESEFDVDIGFADIDQTTGGTLGAYYDPAESPPLPWD